MGFFTEFYPLIDGLPVTMRIMRTGDKITVGVLPDEIKGLEMLQVTGTVEELDAEFFNTVRQPLTDTITQMNNVAKYGASLQQVVKDKMDETKPQTPKGASQGNKDGAKKNTSSKSKPPVKKSAPAKKVAVTKKDVAAAKDAIKKLVPPKKAATGKKSEKQVAQESLDQAIAEEEVQVSEEVKKGPEILPFL